MTLVFAVLVLLVVLLLFVLFVLFAVLLVLGLFMFLIFLLVPAGVLHLLPQGGLLQLYLPFGTVLNEERHAEGQTQ